MCKQALLLSHTAVNMQIKLSKSLLISTSHQVATILSGHIENMSDMMTTPVKSWEELNGSAWVHLSMCLSICHVQ